jgi:hypothetical protein
MRVFSSSFMDLSTSQNSTLGQAWPAILLSTCLETLLISPPFPRPSCKELLRVRAVRRLPDGGVQAVNRTVASVRFDPDGVTAMAEPCVRPYLIQA